MRRTLPDEVTRALRHVQSGGPCRMATRVTSARCRLTPSGFTVPALVRPLSRSQFLLYCGAQVRGLGRGCTQRGGTQFQKQVDRTFPVGEWDQVALHLALRRNIRRDCQRRLSGSGLRVYIGALINQELNDPLRITVE